MSHAPCVRLEVDNEFPEPRAIAQSVAVLELGGVIVYPTDTNYGIGCSIFNKKAIDRIYKLKNVELTHPLSIVCPDLSDIARYALVESEAYRMMKRHLPGPYTFILKATPEVPKIFQSKRKTVGIRVPNNPVTLALARTFRQPIVSTSATYNGQVLYDVEDIVERHGHGLDLVLDAGPKRQNDSTVIDLSGPYPEVIREGAGDISWLSV